MKFASFGRERDLQMIEQWITDEDIKGRSLKQTQAAHDLNDGTGTVEAFLAASREAIFSSSESQRAAPLLLLCRIASYYPKCLVIWDELASSSDWRNRFSASCRLYWYIPDQKSDRLFNYLRHDKSKRVRDIAVDRYEYRPNPERIEKVFDADRFDERIRKGQVRI
jgi:hypothetical protein